RRQRGIESLSSRRAQLISSAAGNVRLKLRSSRKVNPRCSISVDNSFRKQIVHRLAPLGNVCSKQVVERAVLTHDYNYMLDVRCSIGVTSGRLVDLSRRGGEAGGK